jgi:hypothetical protein
MTAIRTIFLSAVVLLLLVVIAFAAKDQKALPSDGHMPTVGQVNDETASGTDRGTLSSAKAGEEINWQVISSGGLINGTSDNYSLSGTAGQTAVGGGTSDSYGMNHGFWQTFGCCDTPGDANNDGTCNIGDEVFLGNFVFRSGQCDDPPGNPVGCPPECLAEGDANADGGVNIGDEVFLGNYIFRPPPASPFPQCGPE